MPPLPITTAFADPPDRGLARDMRLRRPVLELQHATLLASAYQRAFAAQLAVLTGKHPAT